MDNNFYNNNENENLSNEETKKQKTRKAFSIVSFVVGLALLFGLTYFITDRLITFNNSKDTEAVNANEKIVYNNTKALSDNMKILLMNDGVVEKEQDVAEFKKENEIAIDISEQFVVNYFTSKGYKLSELKDEKVVFEKETQTLLYEPNKYYLGIDGEYFAIYKTDAEGKMKVDEVLTNFKPVSSLKNRPELLDEIKSFKSSYNTKDEASEALSAYTS